MTYKLQVTPMGKPRMTQRDRWKKRDVVNRYFAFKDAVCLQANASGLTLTDGMIYTFRVPMPQSWSHKKRALMNRTPHKQKPDLDNFIKALWDALCKDDSHISTIGFAQKVWSDEPEIIISDIQKSRSTL